MDDDDAHAKAQEAQQAAENKAGFNARMKNKSLEFAASYPEHLDWMFRIISAPFCDLLHSSLTLGSAAFLGRCTQRFHADGPDAVQYSVTEIAPMLGKFTKAMNILLFDYRPWASMLRPWSTASSCCLAF